MKNETKEKFMLAIAELHPQDIKNEFVIPALKQIIDDIGDDIKGGYPEEQTNITEWLHILKAIERL